MSEQFVIPDFIISRNKQRLRMGRGGTRPWESPDGFRCAHCQAFVSCDPLLCGVGNRNHCPYCLWSRHLDLAQPGDRLCACRSPMRPVGLALKRTHKKYACSQGELMVVHRCQECGKVSANRIAADDIAERLFEVFTQSLEMDAAARRDLAQDGADLLERSSIPLVKARLFGGSG